MLQQQPITLKLAAPPPLDVRAHALFLDLDGTLVPFATSPQQVYASDEVKLLLAQLFNEMGGAVAIVTGRTIESADTVLAGSLINIAGIHGFARRDATRTIPTAEDTSAIDRALHDARLLKSEGQLDAEIEDKSAALTFHYRTNPGAAPQAQHAAQTLARRHGLHVVQGAMVVELTLGVRNKGDAVADFMNDAPFSGRAPIAIGDDITDEDAFIRVNAMNGASILVGPQRQTAARHHLPGIDAAIAWLQAGLAS